VLDLAEKIAAGFAGALVLGTLLVYALVGVPSATSRVFLPDVVEAPEEPARAGPKGEPPASNSAEDKALIEKLLKQGVRVRQGTALRRIPYEVPQETFDYISKEANWLPELKKLQHRLLKDTRLQLHDIQPSSLTKKLGLQENDVLELIDGEIIEFNEQSAVRYTNMFNKAKEKLRNGGEISITVTRNNRPVHLQFKL